MKLKLIFQQVSIRFQVDMSNMKNKYVLKSHQDEVSSLGGTVSIVMDTTKSFARKYGIKTIDEETFEKSLLDFFVRRISTRLEKFQVCIIEEPIIKISESHTGKLKGKLEFDFEYRNCGNCALCKVSTVQRVVVKAHKLVMFENSDKIVLEKNWLALKDCSIILKNGTKMDEGIYCTHILKTKWSEYSYE